jgi:hypothetical protein
MCYYLNIHFQGQRINIGILVQNPALVTGNMSSNNEILFAMYSFFVGPWVVVINSTDEL